MIKWLVDMFSPYKKDIHELNLILDKTRDEKDFQMEEILKSAKKHRLTLAQAGMRGIDDYLKGIK
jgi:hypothetical protein